MSESTTPKARARLLELGTALVLGAGLLLGPAPALAAGTSPAPATSTPAPAAATPATQPKIDPDAVVAKVGNDAITEADLGFAAQDLGQELRNVPPADQRAFLTTVLIDMKVMANAARAENLQNSDEFKQRVGYLEDRELRRDYFAQQVSGAITPAALKTAYDKYVADFKPVPQVHAEHILVKTEAEAKAIETQLKGGASFEDLAKAKSIDTGSGAQGGDLGFFSHGQMVPAFEKAAFALPVGQISAPVKTQYGWHIIKVLAKRDTKPEAMDKIAPQLQQQIVYKIFDTSIAALKKKTTVSIPDASLAAQVKAQEQDQPAAP